MESPVRKESRTDAAGAYTAYIYADGHTETDPPGRPKTREDLQRERLREAAKDRTKRMLEVTGARTGRPGAAVSPRVLQDTAASVGPRALSEDLQETYRAMAAAAETVRSPVSQVQVLLETINLGGPVVGSLVEYGVDQVVEGPSTIRGRTGVLPTEGRS